MQKFNMVTRMGWVKIVYYQVSNTDINSLETRI